MTKDAFYFPHFCNARHDRKIKRIRKELGVEGYGIFFMLLEVLREQADYRYPFSDLDLLADEFGTSEQKVRTVIANYDLFQVDDDDHFFSSNLIMYLGPYLEGKERKRISGIKGNLIRYGYYKKEDLDGKTPEEIEEIAIKIPQFSQISHSDRTAIPVPSQTGRISSQIKGKEIKEIKRDQIKREEIAPLSASSLITDAIKYWNSKNNIPKCSYNVATLPKISEITQKFDVFGIDEIKGAIDNLSKYYDKEDAKYRPSSFQNFISNSVDRWLDIANPSGRYKDEKQPEKQDPTEIDYAAGWPGYETDDEPEPVNVLDMGELF